MASDGIHNTSPGIIDRYARLYEKWSRDIKRYMAENPSAKDDRIQSQNLSCASAELENLKNSIHENNLEGAKMFAERTGQCFKGLYSVDIARLETNIEAASDTKDNAFGIAIGTAVANGVLALGWLAEAAIPYLPVIAGPVLTFMNERAAPMADKILRPVDRITLSAHHYINKIATAPVQWMTHLQKANLVSEPTLSGLNKSLLTLYGAAAVADVASHITEGRESPIAKLPLEGVFGKSSRTFLGIYGNFGITYLIGQRLFGFSGLPALAFTTGHIISEYFAQNESGGRTFFNLDWSRTWGGNVAAMATLGPMRWLWSGRGVWKGWANVFPKKIVETGAGRIFEIPSMNSILGFFIASGLVNSAIFVPTGLFLERANLKNYWMGLTIREFSIAYFRKYLQALTNVNSMASVFAYTCLKPIENKFISQRYSLFEGTGMYRDSMHKLLSEKPDALAFIRGCLKNIGSCDDFLCTSESLDEGDLRLFEEDLRKGIFEINLLTALVDEALRLAQAPDEIKAAKRLKEVIEAAGKIKGGPLYEPPFMP